MGQFCAACCRCCASVCDLDTIFAYSTVKIVHIRDFRLGLIHRIIQVLLLLYFLIYVIIISKQYQVTESAFGDSMTKMHGMSRKTVKQGKSIYYTVDDAENIVYPPSENNALFLATSISYTHGQKVDNCVYPGTNCTKDKDCDGTDKSKIVSITTGKCNKTIGHCIYNMWCPAEDETNIVGANATQVWDYEIEDMTIWVKSSIMFPNLDPVNVYNTIKTKSPVMKDKNPKSYNLFPVSDVLSKIKTSYDDIKEDGCIVELTTNWDCNLNDFFFYRNPVDDRCTTTYEAKRLDDPGSDTGFNFRRTLEYTDPVTGELKRDIFKYNGIRLILSSKGIGYKVSFMQIILQISSLFALLVVSTTVCDLIISLVLKRYKYDKVAETKKFRDEQEELAKKKKELEEKKKTKKKLVGEAVNIAANFANLDESSDDEDDDEDDGENNNFEEEQQQSKYEIRKKVVDENSPLLINGAIETSEVIEQDLIVNSLTGDENSSSSDINNNSSDINNNNNNLED